MWLACNLDERLERFCDAVMAGATLVASRNVAEAMNKAFRSAGIPHEVEICELADDGMVYALDLPDPFGVDIPLTSPADPSLE